MATTRQSILHLILLLVAVAGLCLVAYTLLPPDASDFDAELWRNDVDLYEPYERLELADELIATDRLDGLTREQVVTLLGPDCDCSYFSEWDLVYWLGPERGFMGLDSE